LRIDSPIIGKKFNHKQNGFRYFESGVAHPVLRTQGCSRPVVKGPHFSVALGPGPLS